MPSRLTEATTLQEHTQQPKVHRWRPLIDLAEQPTQVLSIDCQAELLHASAKRVGANLRVAPEAEQALDAVPAGGQLGARWCKHRVAQAFAQNVPISLLLRRTFRLHLGGQRIIFGPRLLAPALLDLKSLLCLRCLEACMHCLDALPLEIFTLSRRRRQPLRDCSSDLIILSRLSHQLLLNRFAQ